MPHLLYPQYTPGTHCPGGCVGLGTQSEQAAKPHPTRIQYPDHLAQSTMLYQLCYPSHLQNLYRFSRMIKNDMTGCIREKMQQHFSKETLGK